MYFDGKLMAQWTNNIPSDAYEILIDLEVAGSGTNGWHSVANASTNPGPFIGNVQEMQVYRLP
jgi:hypothetical protein